MSQWLVTYWDGQTKVVWAACVEGAKAMCPGASSYRRLVGFTLQTATQDMRSRL